MRGSLYLRVIHIDIFFISNIIIYETGGELGSTEVKRLRKHVEAPPTSLIRWKLTIAESMPLAA